MNMKLSRGNKILYIIYTVLIFTAVFLLWNTAQTETQTGNINIDMNVPGVTPPEPETTGPDPASVPEIKNVVSSTGFYQATVNWEVDFKYVGESNTTTIEYGILPNLSSSTAVIASGTEFLASIVGLEEDTEYDFKISARNVAGLTDDYYGKFKTQKENVLESWTILVKPEKRVSKAGGNYGVSYATVLFLDQSASTILYEFSTSLESTGSTTLSNIQVPEGTNLVAVLKTKSHLAKRLNGVNTSVENLVLDFTLGNTFELKAGDVMGSLEETGINNPFIYFLISIDRDDSIDALDISRLSNAAKVRSTEEELNLNMDDIVDALDISIFDFNSKNYSTGDISIK